MGSPHTTKKFRIIRSVVVWLYNSECFICLKKNEKLQVHHLNKINTDNRLENLIPLCSNCHKLIHKSKNKINIDKVFLEILLSDKIKNL